MQVLIKAGADVAVRTTTTGVTPLHLAASSGKQRQAMATNPVVELWVARTDRGEVRHDVTTGELATLLGRPTTPLADTVRSWA